MTPPDWLHADEANAWRRMRAASTRTQWTEQDELELALAAMHCADYVRRAQRFHRIAGATRDGSERDKLEWLRRECRKALVQYEVIRPDEEQAMPLSTEGVDADIAAMCTPFLH